MPTENLDSGDRWIDSSEGPLKIITPNSPEALKNLEEESTRDAADWLTVMKGIRRTILGE